MIFTLSKYSNSNTINPRKLVLIVLPSFCAAAVIIQSSITYSILLSLLVYLSLGRGPFLTKYKLSYLFLTLCVISVSVVNFFLYQQLTPIVYAIFLIFTVSNLDTFARNSNILDFGLQLALILLIATLSIYLLFNPVSGYSYDNLLEGVSSNGWTSVLSIFLALVCLSSVNSLNIYHLILSLIVLSLTVPGYGRGAIITALFVTFTVFIRVIDFPIKSLNLISIQKISFVLILFFIAISFFLYTDQIHEFVIRYTKIRFDSGLLSVFSDPARESIMRDYLNHLDVFSFLFGSDDDGLLFNRHYKGNPHGALLNSHRLYGIFYLALALLVVYNSIMASSFKRTSVLLWSCIIFRLLSEAYGFPSPLDPLYLALSVRTYAFNE